MSFPLCNFVCSSQHIGSIVVKSSRHPQANPKGHHLDLYLPAPATPHSSDWWLHCTSKYSIDRIKHRTRLYSKLNAPVVLLHGPTTRMHSSHTLALGCGVSICEEALDNLYWYGWKRRYPKPVWLVSHAWHPILQGICRFIPGKFGYCMIELSIYLA